jgi:glycosyltransferase involved in cell wall biosynthesis
MVFYNTGRERRSVGTSSSLRQRNVRHERLTDTTRVTVLAHRIAHILAWPTVAGTEISTIRIARGLSGPNFEHLAFCTSDAPAVESIFRTEGFPTASYRSVDLSYRKPGPFLTASIQLARELRRRKVALAHCSDLMAGLRAAPAAKLARLPVICHIRNPEPVVSLHDRPLLRAVDHFVFVSRHAWDSFGYSVPVRRGSIIYDGIETIPIDRSAARHRLLSQFSLPSDSRLVGMVGRLAPQKDHATLIKAAARVVSVDPTVRFLVIGDHTGTDAFRQHYRSLARLVENERLTAHVIFAGFRDDVPQILSGLEVSVLATHFEGFGLVIVEAMAQGTPVIATAVGGVTEIIVEQETGLLHRPVDDADLATKILALLSDKALAERLATAGRRLVDERFTIQRFASNIATLYQRIIGFTHGT